MPRGGFRKRAGRPKGSRDTRPRRWLAVSAAEANPESREAFVEFCRQVADSGRAADMLTKALNSPDEATQWRALMVVLSYGVGLPGHTLTLKGEKIEDVLTEIQERREQRLLAAAGDEEPS